ncbi:hypothetical protein LJU02_09430 [Corynebacterium pseudotuberculosis]|uniref:Uncharacterized protein n=1 Tax=Corynebacterium pseudotuberculosis 258 TaxID=1168865 RepID=A0AAU8PMP7_CORPS|nr:hypothetical protein [Corynebacterium pseudotuberculosis]AER69850.1 Hypothetical protein Cp106_1802 [Corynebacterium pseudotuberculosis 1/06-A]AEQ07375.1 hypothetical protein CPCIP5297_09540 [Corynebacterium pseudotuberculosis CIP 52.97]AFB73193.2 hypothetical protein CP316_09530 [Corynebacterium pseudotuberculosis 316]AFK17480.1 hypothetical protein CP258_09540 [Corynebacterium pseudotuberculosis 258]AKS14190.1 Hypothetical protein CpE19_1853 [Corynebacterium pseudotuberculosis]
MHDVILAAAETAAQNDGKGLYKFFEIVFKNLATINDFIARGLGSSISGDTGVAEGKGFKSVFHFFHQWLTTGSSAPATAPAEKTA